MEKPGMTTQQIFTLADMCIKDGCFPELASGHYILGLQIQGTGTARVKRTDANFRLFHPCRVWLMAGSCRVLLGDSDALPLTIVRSGRPPWTM